jgi:phenylalanyl-tRNA synthetase beta chain
MANVKFDRKNFEKDIGKLDSEMQERIALFGTPVENVSEDTLELEIFPNRPDLLSYQNFKKSFAAFLGEKSGLRTYSIGKPEKNYEVIIDSSVKDVRPYTACAIVKGLKLDNMKIKEIIELQEKLHVTVGRDRKKLAIGIYPLDKIVLPIYYKAVEPDKIKFQPLDYPKEMSGLEILQKHPTGKEFAHLLAGKMKFPIFSDSEGNILSMPPIINSERTGRVTEETKDLFIECSGFSFDVLEKCLSIIVASFAEMGGRVYQMKVKDNVTPSFKTDKMDLSLEKTNKILGLDLGKKELKKLVEKMGHSYSADGKVEISPWRMDILHEIDLIEDVAIAYGYNNFEPIIPAISTTSKEYKNDTIKRKISDILTGLGLLELSNYHLTKKQDQFERMGIPEKEESGFVELSGSKTDYNIMRKDLSHYLLKIISENSDSEYPQKVFESGKVFFAGKDESITEEDHAGAAVGPGNYTDLKQILDYLFHNLGLEFEVREQEITSPFFVEGRSAEITLDGEKIGFIGEIHPRILKNWKIKMPVSIFEINLERLYGKF